MSASLLLPQNNTETTVEERPKRPRAETDRTHPVDSARFDDELWPWVQLPDGRLELTSDAA